MQMLSWILAGLMAALSGAALLIAAYLDMQDHRRLYSAGHVKRTGVRGGNSVPSHSGSRETRSVRPLDAAQGVGPDIIVGPWEMAPPIPANSRPLRKAA